MSYTFAKVPVTPATYAEIRATLVRAGYAHAIEREGAEELIDMRGLALVSYEDPAAALAPPRVEIVERR